jgi:CRP-like cAMP-binding protein
MEPAGLKRLPFFGGLPRWALARLAEAAQEEELPAGRTVLHQHDRTRTVHLLLAGALQIYVPVGDDDLLVAVLGDPGELVGLPTALPRDRLGPLRAAEPADQLPKPSGTRYTPVPASAARTPASGAPRGRYRPWWMTSIISGIVVRLIRGRPCLTPAVTS